MHGHTLKYRVSQQGVASNPNSITAADWTAGNFNSTTGLFNAQTSQLVAGSTVTGVTYPHFINTPAGALQLTYRTGSSGNGSNWLADYTAATHTWGNVHQYDDGSVGTYNGTVTVGDTNRNSYINGITYGPTGRLYQSFTWREGATGAANHDIAFVYSDDKGNTWKNNAGTVVGNSATGLKWNLNTPGLTVVPLDESQSLMNQQTQAVTSDDKFHTMMWHRDTAKSPASATVYAPTESSYFDYWRDGSGNWHRNKLPGAVGQRPKMFFDANDNAIAIYQAGAFTSSGIYINNGDLVIAAATKSSNWTDWKIIKTEAGPFVSETQADARMLALNGTLSVVMQESPTATTPAQGTNMRALDFAINLVPATDRTLSTTGNFATTANWGGTTPAGNANAIISGGRTATLSSAATAIDNSLIIGNGGTAGTFTLSSGGSLTVGGSVIVGRDGGSVGTFNQNGGSLNAWRMVVGDYYNETSGGGTSNANIAAGTITVGELQIAMSATGSSNNSSFTVAGSGNVAVNGEILISDCSGTGSLNLAGGGTLTVAGDIREGLNGNNTSSVNFTGGTLDMTGNAIRADMVSLSNGTIRNVNSINTLNGGSGTITRTDAATATLSVNDGSFGGSIQNGNGVVSLNKVTAGALTLSGANTYTGVTTITAGVLRAQNNSALGATAGNTVIAGGTSAVRLELAGNINLAEPLSLGGRSPTGVSADAPHLSNFGGTNTFSGTLASGVGGNQYNVSADGGKLIVTGAFINNGTGGAADIRYLKLMGAAEGAWQSNIANNAGGNAITAVTKMGAGLWTLSGNNTYTGVTAVKGGTLSVPQTTNVLSNAGGVDLSDSGGTLAVTYTGASPAASMDALLTTSSASTFANDQIRSSDLAAGHTIGLSDDGAGTVRVRVTLPGDADLNGSVDFNDFLKLQNGFGNAGTRFDQGDFNYDGVTDFNDFLALQNNFGQSISGAAVAVSKSQIAAMTAVAVSKSQIAAMTAFAAAGGVPEPAGLAMIGIAAAGMLRHRRIA